MKKAGSPVLVAIALITVGLIMGAIAVVLLPSSEATNDIVPANYPYRMGTWAPGARAWEITPLADAALSYLKEIEDARQALDPMVNSSGRQMLGFSKEALEQWNSDSSLYLVHYHSAFKQGRLAKWYTLMAAEVPDLLDTQQCRLFIHRHQNDIVTFDGLGSKLQNTRQGLSLLGLKYLAYAEYWWAYAVTVDRASLNRSLEVVGNGTASEVSNACAVMALLIVDTELINNILDVAQFFKGSPDTAQLALHATSLIDEARSVSVAIKTIDPNSTNKSHPAYFAAVSHAERMELLEDYGLLEGALEYAQDVLVYARVASSLRAAFVPADAELQQALHRALVDYDHSIPVTRIAGTIWEIRNPGKGLILQDQPTNGTSAVLAYHFARDVPTRERVTRDVFGQPYFQTTETWQWSP